MTRISKAARQQEAAGYAAGRRAGFREGAEWMRERAANAILHHSRHEAGCIRVLPIEELKQ
jgi:hypothetical protein